MASRAHVMISSRFDGKDHEARVRRVAQKLKQRGTPIYIVEAGAGERFGEMTVLGLAGAFAMVAFCSCHPPYGEKTESKYCTYYELKFAHDNALPIIAVQMGGTFPPETPEPAGTAMNRFVLSPDMLRIDGRNLGDDALADNLHAVAQKLLRKIKELPSSAATGQPSSAATGQPSSAATGQPSSAATGQPSSAATGQPSSAATLPAPFALPWLPVSYSTRFTPENQQDLKDAGLFGKQLVKLGGVTGPYQVQWKQISRGIFDSVEEYYVAKYQVDGESRVVLVAIAMNCGVGPDIIDTSGTSYGGGQLHFGYANITAQEGVVFFVLHDNSWGPFQNRFNDCLRAGNAAHNAKNWAAGTAASAAASAALTAYFGGAAAVASTGVGIPIAVAAGAVGFVAGDLASRLGGCYLRFIGG